MFASVEENEVIDPEEVLQRVGSEPCPTDSTRSPEGGLVGRGRQGGSPRSSGDGVPDGGVLPGALCVGGGGADGPCLGRSDPRLA